MIYYTLTELFLGSTMSGHRINVLKPNGVVEKEMKPLDAALEWVETYYGDIAKHDQVRFYIYN